MILIFVDSNEWSTMQNAIIRIDNAVAKIATTIIKLEKQMSELSDAVTAVSTDLDSLSTKLDNETTEIGKVIALLSTTNPDVPAAVTALQGIHGRVGGLATVVDQHVSTLDAVLPPSP